MAFFAIFLLFFSAQNYANFASGQQGWKEALLKRQAALGKWEIDAVGKYAALMRNGTPSDAINWPKKPRLEQAGKRFLSCYYTYDAENGPRPSQIGIALKLDEQFVNHQLSEFSMEWNLNVELSNPHLCTHILLDAGSLNYSLHLIHPSLSILKDVHSIKKRNPDIKLMLTFGPQSNSNMSVLVANATLIERFSTEVMEFLNISGFDGLDIDWEFPVWSGAPTDKQGFIQLLKALRIKFKGAGGGEKRYLLSAAVPAPWNIVDECCDVPEMNKYLDFINLMTYDFHKFQWYTPFTGHNSPLFKKPMEIWILSRINTEYATFYWYSKGMDYWKILVGIPTYARGYNLLTKYLHFDYAPAIGVSATGESTTYYDILSRLEKGYVRVWDEHAMVPYCYKDRDWWSYEDVQSATAKAMWIREQNFGGAMVFNLNSDDWAGRHSVNGTKLPITGAIHNTLYKKGLHTN